MIPGATVPCTVPFPLIAVGYLEQPSVFPGEPQNAFLTYIQ